MLFNVSSVTCDAPSITCVQRALGVALDDFLLSAARAHCRTPYKSFLSKPLPYQSPQQNIYMHPFTLKPFHPLLYLQPFYLLLFLNLSQSLLLNAVQADACRRPPPPPLMARDSRIRAGFISSDFRRISYTRCFNHNATVPSTAL